MPGMRNYDELVAVLEECRAEARLRPLALGEAFDRFGESSYAFVNLLLALPFLQPISLGPLATIGGLNFALLGWQLLRGQQTPWLPRRVRDLHLPERAWTVLLGLCLRVLRFCHRFTKPRARSWVSGRRGEWVGGLLVILAGLLMAVPLAGIPFNNLLPALVIVFVAVGELEQDGWMIAVALFWLVVSAIYIGLVVYAILFLGVNALDWLGDWFGI